MDFTSIENYRGLRTEQAVDTVPGEAVNDNEPWNRIVKDRFVRYTLPIFVDYEEIEFTEPKCQKKLADTFKGDIRTLRKLGIAIPKTSVTVGQIPEFDMNNEYIGQMPGLIVKSEIVDGIGLDEHMIMNEDDEIEEKTERLANGLMHYLNSKEHEWLKAKKEKDCTVLGGCFLGKIVDLDAYVYGTTRKDEDEKLYLSNLDPYFLKSSSRNFTVVRERVNGFTEIARELTKEHDEFDPELLLDEAHIDPKEIDINSVINDDRDLSLDGHRYYPTPQDIQETDIDSDIGSEREMLAAERYQFKK